MLTAGTRLIAHNLVIGEHLLDCSPRGQLLQLPRHPR